MSRPKATIALVVVVAAIAGAALTGWQTGWPPTLFGSSRSGQPLGPHIQVSRIGSRSATPYQVGSGEYVNSRAAWKSLSTESRAALVRQLHVSERRFKALGRKVFPPARSFTVRAMTSAGVGHSAADVLLAARSGGAPGYVSEDFGATAFGDRSFDYGKATYAGATGMWSWTPCASGPSALPGTPEVTICGGQALGVTRNLPLAGMTVTAVIVYGEGAALAAQPVIASFTNRSGHAANLAVSGTAASVTASLRTSPVSAACSPASLLYAAPSPDKPSAQLTDRSQMTLADCAGSLDAIAPVGKALKVLSALRTWVSFTHDAYDTVSNAQQLRSSAALQACGTGRMLSYIASVLVPVGVPTCTPTVLPQWSSKIAAGQTVRFAVTPIVEEHFVGSGEGEAMLFSFIHLNVSESPVGAPPCTQSALTRAVAAVMNAPQEGGVKWEVSTYACQSGYSLVRIHVFEGLDLVAILKQQGSSWKLIYGPTEGLCIEPVDLKFCPHHQLPLPLAILRSLEAKAVATSASSPAAMPSLYLHTPFTYGLYQYPNFPTKIGLDNFNYITSLQWSLTGNASAMGTGILHYNNCQPGCAQGTYITYPVAILATSPQNCSVAPSQGAQPEPAYVFNDIQITPVNDQPPASLMGFRELSPAC